MAQDIFLNLSGIAGESIDATHTGDIEVLEWAWSVRQPANMHAGSGGGAGKCAVEDLTFDHYTDRASPNLVQYCLTGKHIARAILVMRKAGGSPLEYLKMTMEDVLVTQVAPVYYNTMRVPRERVALSFSRFRQEYVVQNASGGSAGTIGVGYDVKANAVI
jgi:type VI secretion system secreted protein Hcp